MPSEETDDVVEPRTSGTAKARRFCGIHAAYQPRIPAAILEFFVEHTQIDKARTDAAAARAELASVRSSGGSVDAARLERALGELALATKTVQRVLVEKGLCTHDEFEAKLRQIDLEDGRADRRLPV